MSFAAKGKKINIKSRQNKHLTLSYKTISKTDTVPLKPLYLFTFTIFYTSVEDYRIP